MALLLKDTAIFCRASSDAAPMLCMAKKICSVEECSSKAIARGWCPKHYKRWLAHGDPLLTLTPNLGRGFIYNKKGYKVIRVDGKRIKEHVHIMENHIGRKLFKHPTDKSLNEVVHHDNEIKDDNRLENLILMTNGEHTILHKTKLRLAKGNTETHKYCPDCKTVLPRNMFGLDNNRVDKCQKYCKEHQNKRNAISRGKKQWLC